MYFSTIDGWFYWLLILIQVFTGESAKQISSRIRPGESLKYNLESFMQPFDGCDWLVC